MSEYSLQVLGTYGIPNNYGGAEQFIEMLAPFLVEEGWKVRVFCQIPGDESFHITNWNGVELYHVPGKGTGPKSTIDYDIRCMRYALKSKMPILTMGYNTAFLNLLPRLFRIPNVIQMDGIEWKREKWGKFAKALFYVNERCGCYFGDHLIADHPEIKTFLTTRTRAEKISVLCQSAMYYEEPNLAQIESLGLSPKSYLTLVARVVPENQILEIVRAFSRRKRNIKLLVLGRYEESNPYAKQIREAASDEVVFPGPIYQPQVGSLRYYTLGYLHGHTVGGTNPSLLEAMHSHNPVIAHNNKYNRWVAGEGAMYFDTEDDLDQLLTTFLSSPQKQKEMAEASKQRFQEQFSYEYSLGTFRDMLVREIDKKRR